MAAAQQENPPARQTETRQLPRKGSTDSSSSKSKASSTDPLISQVTSIPKQSISVSQTNVENNVYPTNNFLFNFESRGSDEIISLWAPIQKFLPCRLPATMLISSRKQKKMATLIKFRRPVQSCRRARWSRVRSTTTAAASLITSRHR